MKLYKALIFMSAEHPWLKCFFSPWLWFTLWLCTNNHWCVRLIYLICKAENKLCGIKVSYTVDLDVSKNTISSNHLSTVAVVTELILYVQKLITFSISWLQCYCILTQWHNQTQTSQGIAQASGYAALPSDLRANLGTWAFQHLH